MLSFWKVMLKSSTFWPFFSTNLSQKHKIIFLSSMKLVTIPQKLFPNPKSIFTISEKIWQRLELVWQRYNCFSIFPIFHFSSRLPIDIFPDASAPPRLLPNCLQPRRATGQKETVEMRGHGVLLFQVSKWMRVMNGHPPPWQAFCAARSWLLRF